MDKKVLIIAGSRSDAEAVDRSEEYLIKLGIGFETEYSSAHRDPDRTADLAREAEANGFKVVICLAGMSAALPGVVAAHTSLPVIGVPLDGSALNGMDALMSVVQMPPGIPVAAVAVGKPGAINAAVLAARILALNDDEIRKNLNDYRESLKQK
ncbi:MAG: 5-(carboxyamino)imidazole ribonucleotide mutase [Candidatus Zixiibacteriota bacterium]